MAYTYTAQNAVDLTKVLLKNVGQFDSMAVQCCDMVSSKMWYYAPWQESQTTIATGLIPLSDGTQDYSSPPNIFRLLKGWLNRTDVTPNQKIELDVVENLDVSIVPAAYTVIRAICLQPAIGQLRLEQAIQVPSGMTIEINGVYQLHHQKITALTAQLWCKDQYFDVFIKGLQYWGYKLSDDSRAGTEVVDNMGRKQYTGQLGEFMGALNDMAQAEDFGGNDNYFPESTVAPGTDMTTVMWPIP